MSSSLTMALMLGRYKMTCFDYFSNAIESSKRALSDSKMIAVVDAVVDVCVKSINNGGKILLAGNGGSAADSQHIAGELVSRFFFDRKPLPALALTTDTSILTAIGNDYGYEDIFARQLAANGRAGDIFFAYSTSGSSPNIVRALQYAKSSGIITVGLTGARKGSMLEFCDYSIEVDSISTPHIQESHLVIGHAICMMIEAKIFS